MTFNDDIASGLATIFSHAGTAATYTPSGGGDPVSCTIMVDSERVIQPGGFVLPAAAQELTLEVQISEVASVSKGDTFETADRTYMVMSDEELENDGLTIKAAVR